MLCITQRLLGLGFPFRADGTGFGKGRKQTRHWAWEAECSQLRTAPRAWHRCGVDKRSTTVLRGKCGTPIPLRRLAAEPPQTSCMSMETERVWLAGAISSRCTVTTGSAPSHPLWIATLIATPAQRMSGAWSQHTRSGVLGPWAEAGTLPTSNCAASPSMRKSRRSHLRAISAT